MSLERRDDRLSEDQVFNLLSSSRRRRVLRRLVEDRAPVGLQQLANEIAARENDKPVGQLTSRERKRVYVSLYQTHVPAMVDAGVVDYDPDSGQIRPKAEVSQLRHYLVPGTARPDYRPRLARYESGGESDPTWGVANTGLVLVGVVALLGVVVTLPPVDPVTTIVIVGLVVLGATMFALLAARLSHSLVTPPSSAKHGVWVVDDVECIGEGERGHRTTEVTDDGIPPRGFYVSSRRAAEVRTPDRDEG